MEAGLQKGLTGIKSVCWLPPPRTQVAQCHGSRCVSGRHPRASPDQPCALCSALYPDDHLWPDASGYQDVLVEVAATLRVDFTNHIEETLVLNLQDWCTMIFRWGAPRWLLDSSLISGTGWCVPLGACVKLHVAGTPFDSLLRQP